MFKELFIRRKENNDSYERTLQYRTRCEYLQNRLEKVRMMYDMESDPDRLEALIYEEKALMIRLNHLIKEAKGL